ncbi:MAG: hypothetical protein HC869_16865 [Rhodospirillales bacterium]|nr:hypothetical protein [Rhodospirillales bacterium]
MADQINALVLDLVEWVAKEPRPYADVMDAWRTSCPRLTIFEDAVDRGFIESRTVPGGGVLVTATDAGTAMLRGHGRGQHAVSVRR